VVREKCVQVRVATNVAASKALSSDVDFSNFTFRDWILKKKVP
jgi:hypothetical protein